VLVLLLAIFIAGCQSKSTPNSTPAEPSPRPPIIFTPVPPPPSPTIAIYNSSPAPITYYTLAVSISPSESGTVTLEPQGGNYPSGTLVTLTAIPTPGYKFDHWSGDASGTTTAVTLTMNSNERVTANFK
jgi:hypothetical protein